MHYFRATEGHCLFESLEVVQIDVYILLVFLIGIVYGLLPASLLLVEVSDALDAFDFKHLAVSPTLVLSGRVLRTVHHPVHIHHGNVAWNGCIEVVVRKHVV